MSYETDGVVTLIPPPAGYVVDFAHPTRSTEVMSATYAVTAVGMTLAVVFLAQRIYTKVVLLHNFQLEDGTLLLAWIGTTVTQALILRCFAVGTLGVHAWEVSIEGYNYNTRLILAASLVYAPTTALSKVTLSMFYLRVSPVTGFRVAVGVTMAVIVLGMASIFFCLLFACNPVAASWDVFLLLAPGTTCLDRGAIYLATAALGIATDLALLLLPVPTVLSLQMPMRQKIGLLIIFAIGSMTLVTSIVRLVILIPSLNTLDQTWILSDGCLWINVEANLLIMCCSLTTLRVFLNAVAPDLIGESSDSRGDLSGSVAMRTFGKKGQTRAIDTLVELEHGVHRSRNNNDSNNDNDDNETCTNNSRNPVLRHDSDADKAALVLHGDDKSFVDEGGRRSRGDAGSEESILQSQGRTTHVYVTGQDGATTGSLTQMSE